MMHKIRTEYQSNRRKLLVWGAVLLVLLALAGRSVSSDSQPSATPSLRINEFMASNGSGLADEDGDLSDWIEIYNGGDQPINLSGYSLTDDPNRPIKWRFPNRTVGPDDYLLIFASGKNRQPAEPAAPLHTNFRLRKSGEFLGLYSILDQTFVDAIGPQYSAQFQDRAYGRYGAGQRFGYLASPSPGSANDTAQVWVGMVQPVQFSLPHGFYEGPIQVALSTATSGATIRYTLDGSKPTETHGLSYSAPLDIEGTTLVRAAAFKEGLLPAAATAQTYLYLADVLAQPADPPGFPARWGRHQEDFKEFKRGMPVQPDYEMDPEIVDDPRYRDELVAGLTAIPSLSLVTEMQHFTELYSNPQNRGRLWERPVSVELIDPKGSDLGFQVNAGLRIQGGVGRKEFYPKHSFRLFFRSDYGPTRLKYPLFKDSPVTEFDTLVLRGGVNRSFVGTFENRETTYTRDEWLRASQIEMSGTSAHGTFVHLYLNGLYWGLYNLIERPDAAFAAAYLGGSQEDWVVMNHSGPVDGPDKYLVSLIEQYRAFNTLPDDPARRQAYREAIQSLVDVPQFFDYVILNWYAGNEDWGENNWYAAMRPPNGQLNYFVWDGEKIFFEGAEIYLGKQQSARPNVVRPVLELLLEDADFKMLLADRMHRHLFNDGALTDANATARWLALTAPLEQAIVGESARWGDGRHDEPITQDDWLEAGENVKHQMEGNAARLIQKARAGGFYPPLDPPDISPHGGLVTAGTRLTMTLPPGQAGAIYFTTNGSDPRRAGQGDVAASARLYRGPVTLTATTLIKARAFNGDSWSALDEAAFQVAEQVNRLRITELMYNPLDGSDYEFIELKNTGNTALSLANAAFEGIDFTFPANTPPLEPGQFLVLVRNPAAFAERYPAVPVDGVYRANLSNAGETITLRDERGQVLAAVTYDDERGWPISPDGRGDSLVLVDFEADPADPKSWRASDQLHGSPGR